MYEMYPDVWTVPEDRRPQTPGLRPRRRARKEHSVVPAILNTEPTKAGEPQPRSADRTWSGSGRAS